MNIKTIFAATLACMAFGSSVAWGQCADFNTSTIKNCNGIDYELWNQNNKGTVNMKITGGSTNPNGGTFSGTWNGTENILIRAGKKWGADSKTTPKGVGNISLEFAATWTSGDNVKMLGIYGWAYYPQANIPKTNEKGQSTTFSNQIEYYIIQDRGSYNPASGGTNAKKYGEGTIDGILYEFYVADRLNQPMLTGNGNFKQYFSVPKSTNSHRQSGTVSVAQHFAAWDKAGMKMMDCALYEVAMKVESYTGSATGKGSANVTKNLLTLGGPTGITENSAGGISQQVKIAQGSNSRDLSIQLAPSLENPAIRVYNMAGTMVASHENRHSIQLPNMGHGIYFVKVQSMDQSHTSRVVVH
ncbi:MAG: hypothetical protein RL318_3118 [Fibrobacterota bacterium]|jgi:hypothetical protein